MGKEQVREGVRTSVGNVAFCEEARGRLGQMCVFIRRIGS